MTVERRQQRYSTRVLVRYHVFDAKAGELNVGQIVATQARDFSRSGLFLAGVDLPTGTRLHFYFDLPSGCVEAFGEVVHDHPRWETLGGEREGCGIRLLSLPAGDRARLDRFLQERREADLAAANGALVRVRAERMRRLKHPPRKAG
jgi:hypothetical protein